MFYYLRVNLIQSVRRTEERRVLVSGLRGLQDYGSLEVPHRVNEDDTLSFA